MIMPPQSLTDQRLRPLADGFFTWLISGEIGNTEPVQNLVQAFEDMKVSSCEILSICAFATFAAQLEPGIEPKLDLFRAIAEIPDDFSPSLRKVKSAPGGGASSATQVLSSPSPEEASAVADEVISYQLQRRIRRRRRLS